MVRYDPYTDSFTNSFIDNPTKEKTATINLDALPKAIIQRNIVEVSDESIEKIADAVVRKLSDRKTTQTDAPVITEADWKRIKAAFPESSMILIDDEGNAFKLQEREGE